MSAVVFRPAAQALCENTVLS